MSRFGDRLEDIANAATHGLGLLGSLAAAPILILLAARRGDAWTIAGVTVFGLTLVSVYTTSTMYHALPPGRRKELWRRLDHASIYLLIAGTYTPFTLGVLRGAWGWTLFAIVWTVAAAGACAKLVVGPVFPRLSTGAYLGLGWLAVVAIEPLSTRLGWAGFAWLFGGGAAYTIGVIFFMCDRRLRFGHCVWHIFVLGGSACHAIAVATYGITAAG